MESKFVPELDFAGECIDYDGITGGFNFQGAWTTRCYSSKKKTDDSILNLLPRFPFAISQSLNCNPGSRKTELDFDIY